MTKNGQKFLKNNDFSCPIVTQFRDHNEVTFKTITYYMSQSNTEFISHQKLKSLRFEEEIIFHFFQV
jgi:hypothetical protein